MTPAPIKPAARVNVRTPEVMERVQAQVESHYRSPLVEKIKARGGTLTVGNTTLRLAKDFGFCYGVERAIDLAYAARKVFDEKKVYLLGEIIHNPEVNRQLLEMGIISIPLGQQEETVATLTSDDVVIVPAFGAETKTDEHHQIARLLHRRHHLWGRDERVEARARLCYAGRDQHHPWQGRA